MDCRAIGTADVRRVLDLLWPTVSETASRVRGRIESVLDFAKATQGFSWSLQDGGNPARWKGHLQYVYAARNKSRDQKHFEAMPYGDVGAFVAELRERSDIAARALEFCILTVGRTDQVLSATWDEVNLETKIWAIPGGRMKNDKPHQVPLSDAAVDVLRFMASIRSDDRIFPIGPAAMRLLLREMRPGSGLTVHGFRSSFRDWSGDCSPHAREIIEAAMSHTVGDATENAYRRTAAVLKRARLMEDWAAHCALVAGANVVALDRPLEAANG
jgi:integrase